MCLYEFCLTIQRVLQDMRETHEFTSVGRNILALNMYSCQDHNHNACVRVSVVLYVDKVHCRHEVSGSGSRTDFTASALYCVVLQLHQCLCKET